MNLLQTLLARHRVLARDGIGRRHLLADDLQDVAVLLHLLLDMLKLIVFLRLIGSADGEGREDKR